MILFNLLNKNKSEDDMGQFKRAGTEITDFWPDDSDTEIYLEDSITTLQDIIDKAQEKWPTMPFSEVQINPKKIHTHCLYYDRYDPSDHTDFIVLTCDNEAVKEYFKAKALSEQLEENLKDEKTEVKLPKIKI